MYSTSPVYPIMPTPTPEQIQYMQEHINDTLVPSMHISNGIMVGAATVSVAMRFMARRMSASGIGKDDICLFVAYVSYILLVFLEAFLNK